MATGASLLCLPTDPDLDFDGIDGVDVFFFELDICRQVGEYTITPEIVALCVFF